MLQGEHGHSRAGNSHNGKADTNCLLDVWLFLSHGEDLYSQTEGTIT